MKIAVVGTGYVGLVTGVALSHIGHRVTCIDIDEHKVEKMRQGIPPIYEAQLEELMRQNLEQGRLDFTSSHAVGFEGVSVIYIAVGTPERDDGSVNLQYIEQAAYDIAAHVRRDIIVVIKSTVPVGTCHYIKDLLRAALPPYIKAEVASNPEFLREGTSVYDIFHGDRIVIGTDDSKIGEVIEEINRPFGIPIFKTDIKSAEMIKYASNTFLATKISFINEIANICEKLGADIEDVAYGMGLDKRIGSQFLNAGIGYGGSCFPKDTKALTKMAVDLGHNFELLEAVIRVNNNQQHSLVRKAKERFGSIAGKRVALLGLSFKPNTDDVRDAASIVVSRELIAAEATVVAYDPIAEINAKKVLPKEVQYVQSLEQAVTDADAAFILTEWNDIRNVNLSLFVTKMKTPILFDGRNCFDIREVEKHSIEYYSIGRRSVCRVVVQS